MTELALVHLSASGEANMVDVGGKPATLREATAESHVVMAPVAASASPPFGVMSVIAFR